MEIGYKVDKQQISSFNRWIEKMIKMDGIGREERIRIMIVILIACWIIRKERCNNVFKRKEPDVERCIIRINGLVEELLQIQGHDVKKENTR